MSSVTIPAWVRDLVCKLGGGDPWFVMSKFLEISDLNLRDQNRLLIPSPCVEHHLIPKLSVDEKAAANLVQPKPRRRSMPGTHRVRGREHGGLEVCVYPPNGFRCHLKLTCWDSTASTVINGPEYKNLLAWSSLQENDEVLLWGFRQVGDGKLCFVLGEKMVS